MEDGEECRRMPPFRCGMATGIMNAEQLWLPEQGQALHASLSDRGGAHEATPPLEALLAVNGC